MSQGTNDLAPSGVVTQSSPVRKLLSGSAVYGLGTILVQTINILLMPILTAHLSATEYGAIALLNFAALIISGVFSLGVNSSLAICYFDQESRRWRDTVVSTAFGLMVLSALALALLTYGSLPWSVKWLLGKESYSSAMCYAALASGVTMLVIPFDNRLRLDERPLGFISASFLSTFVIGGLTLWFVIGLERGVRGYFEAMLIGRLVSFFAFYAMAGGMPTLKFSGVVVHKLLRVGLPIMPQFLLLYFLQYGNIDLLKRLGSLEQAGIFAAGLTIGLASNVVISSIANAWAPFFLSYSNRREEASELFGRITKYYILGVGLFSLLFYYFAKVLMRILSAPEYFSGYQVVGPVATGMFMLGLSNMFLPPTYFAKEAGKITYIGVAAVAVQVGLAHLLIPTFGIMGAAWATACSYVGYAFLLLLLNLVSSRYFRIRYQWWGLGLFGFSYVASCLGIGLLTSLNSYLELGLYFLHFGVMLGIAYRALNGDESRVVTRFASYLLPAKAKAWIQSLVTHG